LVNQASRTPSTDTEVDADESADDGEKRISKKDLLAALPDENLSTAGMMFVLESRLPDLVATVNEMLADLNLPTSAGADDIAGEGDENVAGDPEGSDA
jgi:hypothetical protein